MASTTKKFLFIFLEFFNLDFCLLSLGLFHNTLKFRTFFHVQEMKFKIGKCFMANGAETAGLQYKEFAKLANSKLLKLLRG